jgi:hypothetical protein
VRHEVTGDVGQHGVGKYVVDVASAAFEFGVALRNAEDIIGSDL